jgi:hypothetical protein
VRKKSKSKEKKKVKTKMSLPIYEQLPHLFDTTKIQKYFKTTPKDNEFNMDYEDEKSNLPVV